MGRRRRLHYPAQKILAPVPVMATGDMICAAEIMLVDTCDPIPIERRPGSELLE
jgi:hypothetical protein